MQRPWATITLVIVLFVDAAALPRESSVGQFFTISHGCRCCRHGPWMYLGLTDNGVWLQLDGPEYQRTDLSLEALVSARPWPRRQGWYALTTEVINPTLHIDAIPRVLTLAETAQVHAMFADHMMAEQWFDAGSPIYQLVRAQSGPIASPLVAGYVHNGAALVLLGMLIWSLGWIPMRMHHARMRQAILRGLCSICSYDLRCSGDRCPECGWHPDQTPDLRPTARSFHDL